MTRYAPRPPAQIEIYRLDDRTPYLVAPAGSSVTHALDLALARLGLLRAHDPDSIPLIIHVPDCAGTWRWRCGRRGEGLTRKAAVDAWADAELSRYVTMEGVVTPSCEDTGVR